MSSFVLSATPAVQASLTFAQKFSTVPRSSPARTLYVSGVAA
jgi:hypothetical protein